MTMQIASAPTATDRAVLKVRRPRERGRKPRDASADALQLAKLLCYSALGQLGSQVAVGIGPPVAEKLPGAAHFLDHR